jgi:hypothetical protein
MKPVLKSATSTCPQCGAEARPLLFSFSGPAHCKNCGTYFVIEPVFKMPEPAPASTEPPNPLLLENLKRPRVTSPLANAWGAVALSIAWIIISSIFVNAGVYIFSKENRGFLYAASGPSISAIKATFGRPIPLGTLIFTGVGGLLLIFGLWLLYDSLRGVYQLNRLGSQGCQTEGVIFDRWVDINQIDENQTTMGYFVAFAFRVPMRGSPMDGKVITRAERNEKAYDRYHTGDPLTIRYLPEDPSICEMVMDG